MEVTIVYKIKDTSETKPLIEGNQVISMGFGNSINKSSKAYSLLTDLQLEDSYYKLSNKFKETLAKLMAEV